MPLIEPVPLLPVDRLGAVHFIGVGGAGMSGIAAMYAELGVDVSGSDQADSAMLERLRQDGVRTVVGHHRDNLGNAETVVVSSAIRADNPELSAARERGLRIWHRSAALGALMMGRRGVAVTGTHGKTTTSAMIATVLTRLGADPGYVVGSPLTATGQNHRLGAGAPFVVEADESDGSFRQYPAEIVVITNIESDHLDNWGDAEAYARGFLAVATAATVEVVILNSDDPGTAALIDPARAAGKTVITVGEDASAQVRLTEVSTPPGGGVAQLISARDQGVVELVVPGRFNLHNAAAAYAVALALGLSGEPAREALGGFRGTHRRFQPVAEVGGARIFDDYAHHPTEVAATLGAARELAGDSRLVVCFQPHLFTRTRDFATEFGRVLSSADHILVLDIYPAREDPLPGVTGRLVADAAAAVAGAERVSYAASVHDGAQTLAQLIRPGDVVVTIGAGDVTAVGPLVADLLRTRSA
jgi:UDP-N-acetylmuramate--alanine ligase